MKVDLKKYKKRLKAMEPNKYEFITCFISLLTGAVAYDLKLYALLGVSGWLFLGFMVYGLCWCIDSIIYILLKKKQVNQKVDIKDDK